MKKRKIILAFYDGEYAEAAAMFLAQNEKYLNVAVRDYRYKRRENDEIIIIDRSIDEESEMTICFDRFIEMDKLIHEIRERSGNITYVNDVNDDIDVIAVVGDRGGAGVSSVAEGIAKELTVYHGKRVIILDFSPFSYKDASTECSNVKELICMLGKKAAEAYDRQNKFDENLQNYIAADTDGIGRFNYGNGTNYLSYNETDEVMMLFQYLLSACTADYIILDFPLNRLAGLYYSSDSMLAYCIDTIVSITSNDQIFKKHHKYAGLIENILSSNQKLKLIKALNFCDEAFLDDNDENEALMIDYDKDSFLGGEVRIDGSFGIAIKNIAHNLVFC